MSNQTAPSLDSSLDTRSASVREDENSTFVLIFLSTYGAGLGSWLLVLGAVAVYCKMTAQRRAYGLNEDGRVNFESFEQSMIVRLRMFGRAAITALIGCHVWLAYLYFNVEEPLVAPFFGIARPILCFLVAVFGWFADSHPLFRWIFAMGQGLHIFADSYDLWVVEFFFRHYNLNINELSGSCDGKEDDLVDSYYSTLRGYKSCHLVYVEQLKYRNYVTIVLGIWAVLQCAYFMVSQGFFFTRYHVFDKTR